MTQTEAFLSFCEGVASMRILSASRTSEGRLISEASPRDQLTVCCVMVPFDEAWLPELAPISVEPVLPDPVPPIPVEPGLPVVPPMLELPFEDLLPAGVNLKLI